MNKSNKPKQIHPFIPTPAGTPYCAVCDRVAGDHQSVFTPPVKIDQEHDQGS